MQERQNIAVFVDYDNIEIGVKSTLRREFAVSICLDALKERGDIVAKFAYANWARQEGAVRQMAENAVQMVQRLPSPRGDKNGADINLALDALEMAFTHKNVNAFAIISGDSDFIPLVNKLKAYGKMIYIVGGKAFTSTILQQNCHEFISYESLLDDSKSPPRDVQPQANRPTPIPSATALLAASSPAAVAAAQAGALQAQAEGHRRGGRGDHRRPAPIDLPHALPLVERALATLRRRGVQPQLGLLKSTMLQLDPSFNERAYGTGSFSDFVDKLESNGYLATTGPEGRKTIEVKQVAEAAATPKKEEALPLLRQVVDIYKLDLEDGVTADYLAGWMSKIHPTFDSQKYGFQSFGEFLNFAQDNYLVRVEADPARGLIAYPGAELPVLQPANEAPTAVAAASAGSSAPTTEPVSYSAIDELSLEPEEGGKPKRGATRKRAVTKKAAAEGPTTAAVRRPRARKPVE